VTLGLFNGTHPSLAFATSSDNIFIHSPHSRTGAVHETRTLNVNRNISALASGDMEQKQDRKREILLIGSATSLQAYDVEVNSDIFFKEIADGVNVIAFGFLPTIPTPLAMVGGNCSLQGFDAAGAETFWTVTGDNVSSLCFRSVAAGDERKQEMVVGSEDCEIRIFQAEEVAHEMTESDIITCLTPVRSTYFGYGLANGSIGVYNNSTRVWHAKSKHNIVSLTKFDLNGDGVPELIAGWSNGRLEVRHDETGDLIYKDRLGSSFAKLCTADYRMDGKEQVMAVSIDGEVRGYLPVEAEQQTVDDGAQENILKGLYDKKNVCRGRGDIGSVLRCVIIGLIFLPSSFLLIGASNRAKRSRKQCQAAVHPKTASEWTRHDIAQHETFASSEA